MRCSTAKAAGAYGSSSFRGTAPSSTCGSAPPSAQTGQGARRRPAHEHVFSRRPEVHDSDGLDWRHHSRVGSGATRLAFTRRSTAGCRFRFRCIRVTIVNAPRRAGLFDFGRKIILPRSLPNCAVCSMGARPRHTKSGSRRPPSSSRGVPVIAVSGPKVEAALAD
jgi:hypothetical protein